MSRLMFIPGMGLVSIAETYDPPPDLRYVTSEDQTIALPRPDISHPGIPSPSVKNGLISQGLWALLAVGALALIADGATLWLIAWLMR